ncbi:polysaccharide deacetylase family protein [Prosthecobacter sp.]|uniref:polysaccharide deacetylase family protein n=1 Tax=Prosthecobacter sp. TaxID=1965333 RepID=UPI0037840E4E
MRLLGKLRSLLESARQKRLEHGSSLKVVFFHALYEGSQSPAALDPLLAHSTDQLAACIDRIRAEGREFLHPGDLGKQLPKKGRFALLTFDDGYANNRLALPILRSKAVSAVFFITSRPVETQQSYWWDVLHRESARRNVSPEELSATRKLLKLKTPDGIQQELTSRFGAQCWKPHGDADRPLDLAELAKFSAEPEVVIGNHTRDHALLAQCGEAELEEQLESCQDTLAQVVGQRPTLLAYPNGRWNDAVLLAARRAGIQAAFTTRSALAPLPLPSSQHLLIPRLAP